MRHLYRELWRHAHGHRQRLVAALALLFASQLIKLAGPYVAAQAIDTLQQQGVAGLGRAGAWLAAVFGLTLASWALHGPGRLLERNVALTVRERVAAGLVERALALPLSWHAAHHSAATAHRLEQSSRALYDFAQSQFVYLQNAVRLVGPVLALWWIDPWVGAAALFGLVAINLSISGFDRAMLRLAKDENDAERRHAAALVDAFGNISSVLALRQRRGVAALVARRLQAAYAPLRRMIVVNEAKWCSVDVLAQALACGLLALYAWHSAAGPTGTLALGSLYMVWEYALQAGSVISSIAAHFQTFARQQADYASGDVLRLALPEAPPEPAAAAARWQRLEVGQLGFRHPGGDGGLADIGLTLERGRRYALVGGSGAGKSTLLKLLAGLLPAQRVTLAADGVPLASTPDAAARVLRGCSTLIPQDSEVFEATLGENLALVETVQGPVPPVRYESALHVAGADAFVDASPAGLARPVGERGSNWSGGQRQRLALARGVLAAEASWLLLLDEPTSSLDASTEAQVLDRLFQACADACIVASIHRLDLLDRFDTVLVMEQGRLVDAGPFDVLRTSSAALRRLLDARR